jgi:glycosyltransferase involved in cell wall biosynthesis
MSAGCAIVASDTAPVRDIIVDDENGVLTPFHDHDGLAAAVCALLADPPRRARLSARARECALTGFDIGVCVTRTLDVLGISLAQRETGRTRLVPASAGG